MLVIYKNIPLDEWETAVDTWRGRGGKTKITEPDPVPVEGVTENIEDGFEDSVPDRSGGEIRPVEAVKRTKSRRRNAGEWSRMVLEDGVPSQPRGGICLEQRGNTDSH